MNHARPAQDDLAEMLATQVDLLDQLLAIGHTQLQAIEQGRMSELLALLSDKQPLLADLNDVAHRLRKAYDSLQPGTTDSGVDLQRLGGLKNQVQQRFESLMELEGKSEAMLCGTRDEIAKRLESSAHSMTAISAYQRAASLPSQGTSLDLSSDR